MKINIKSDFKEDYISRGAGETLRHKIANAIRRKEKLEIDFSEVVVASISFFDEAFAKLAGDGFYRSVFNQLIKLKNLHPRDLELFESLCKKRGFV